MVHGGQTRRMKTSRTTMDGIEGVLGRIGEDERKHIVPKAPNGWR